MPRVAFRQIRSRRAHVNWTSIADEMLKTIEDKSKPELIELHEAWVENWSADSKPEFKARKVLDREGLKIHVFPAGKNKIKWVWMTEGTKPHRIEPVNAKVLAFPSLYLPKTSPGGVFGGPGTSSGDTIFSMGVDHPGTEPREAEKHIKKEFQPTFSRDMENASRRGARKTKVG